MHVGSTLSHCRMIEKRPIRMIWNERTNFEVVQATVIAAWFTSPSFPLGLAGHEDFWVGNADGELTIIAGITSRVRYLRRVSHGKRGITNVREIGAA